MEIHHNLKGCALNLHDIKQSIATQGANLDTRVLKPLTDATERINLGLDVLDSAKDTVVALVEDCTGDLSLESLSKAFADFDTKWDAFSSSVDKAFNAASEEDKKNILAEFARDHFDKKVIAAALVKNETPNILGGIVDIKTAVGSFDGNYENAFDAAIKIKKNVDKIVKAVQQIDGSLDNVFSTVTEQLGINATVLIEFHQRLRDLGNLVPTQIKQSISLLQQGIDVMDASGTMVTALLADCSGSISFRSVATAAAHFDKNWDTFAKNVNTLFKNVSSSDQSNILETFAQSHFGKNVFYTGSAIKKETPNILGGIADFQDAISTFGGSYRNPIDAALKIKTGVEKIIKATERVAGSINNMVKIYRGRGNADGATGIPLLETLSSLHDNAAIQTLNRVLILGGGATAIVGNASDIWKSIKKGDIGGTIAAAQKAAGDFRKLTQNNLKSGTAEAAKTADTQSNSKNTGQTGNSSTAANPIAKSSASTYVASTARIKCTQGSKDSTLTVYPDRTVFLAGKPMANISDHKTIYNLAPFGKCRSLANPTVAAATAAAHGKLTPMPCIPNTTTPWIGGQINVLVKGQPALLKTSTCICTWAGIISITEDGQ